MKNIKPVTKERLGKAAERIERIKELSYRFGGCENAEQVVARACHGVTTFIDNTDIHDTTLYDELMSQMNEYISLYKIDRKEVEALTIGTPIEKYARMRKSVYWDCRTADEIAARANEVFLKMAVREDSGKYYIDDYAEKALYNSFLEYANFLGISKKEMLLSIKGKEMTKKINY